MAVTSLSYQESIGKLSSEEEQLIFHYRGTEEEFKSATLDVARWGYLATLAIEETQSAQAGETPASA
jgi:hypothetical protein